ncbi:MAG: hypothetical protein HUJ26_17125 [Planctomycetaceae bacterium]|nr:hypothetical protein [Planctomycetaceae bacterium]
MLTEQEIRKELSRRTNFALSVSFVVWILSDAYLEIVAPHFGRNASEWVKGSLILLVIPIVLGVLTAADLFFNRHRWFCPECDEDLTKRTQEVLARRLCPLCESRIVSGGRLHSEKAYKRYRELQFREKLSVLFWVWPAVSLLMLGFWFWDSSEMTGCSLFLVLMPLIGTSTAGWAWARTFDRRYRLQFFTCAILLSIGASELWKTI